MVDVGQSAGHLAIAAHNWIGQLTPLHATSSRKVLLAALSPDERRTMTKHLDRFTDQTITDHKALEQELRTVTGNGYSTALDELEVGLRAVAAPVRDHSGATVAAMSVSRPSYHFSDERTGTIVAALKRATAEVNAHLGDCPAIADT